MVWFEIAIIILSSWSNDYGSNSDDDERLDPVVLGGVRVETAITDIVILVKRLWQQR